MVDRGDELDSLPVSNQCLRRTKTASRQPGLPRGSIRDGAQRNRLGRRKQVLAPRGHTEETPYTPGSVIAVWNFFVILSLTLSKRFFRLFRSRKSN